ncbi:MAG: hypothetical protein U0800_11270, partial [Isosphaeraceae bacterium]
MARHLAGWRVVLGLSIAMGGWACTPPQPPPVPPTIPTPKVEPAESTSLKAPAPVEPERPTEAPPLMLSPSKATLLPGDPGLQLLVSGPDESGGRRDCTGEMAWSVEPAGILAIEPGGYVRAIGPGVATIRGTTNGRDVAGTVEVAPTSGGDRPWDFGEDIAPLFTRLGCNTGGCHAKAEGQNGFHLSLFGYDPEGDYRSIVRDAGGRRVSPLSPTASLLLTKATGRSIHGGGQRIAPGSEAERRISEWLASGAPEHRGEGHGRLVRAVVEPGNVRLDQPGHQRFRVIAEYEDGHRRDVTRLASFRSNDDSVVEVDAMGRAVILRRGEADLIVRYQSKVVSVRVASKINPNLAFDFDALPRRNVIDEKL